MTVEARLERVEGSLSPTDAVLAWLALAHPAGSVTRYRQTGGHPDGPDPFGRLLDRVTDGVRRARGSRPAAIVGDAVYRACRDATFLQSLALCIDQASDDVADRLDQAMGIADRGLEDALGPPAPRNVDPRPGGGGTENALRWLALVGRIQALHATEADARWIVEDRYFRRHRVSFPETLARWTAVTRELDDLRLLAEQLAIVRDIPDGARDLRALPSSERVDARVAELIDDGRLVAYTRLGDEVAAAAIAQRRRSTNAGSDL